MTNLILCGGSGTRLWPISRTLMPKQFVKLFGDKSLFQLTLQRNINNVDQTMIVSNVDQYFLAKDQYDEVTQTFSHEYQPPMFILEPLARNTAPAIALAISSLDQDEIVLVTPSDHLIKDEKSYAKVVSHAITLAREGAIVTFGIVPSYPETGFGYIEGRGETVKAFHEKPDLATAQNYLKANVLHTTAMQSRYFWNSGMFCFQVKTMQEAFLTYAPELYHAAKEAFHHASTVQEKALTIHLKDMLAIPEESIDYAIMEKSQKIKVVASDIAWSDVGSFDALYEELPKDEMGNTLCDKYININSKNNLILTAERKISTVDVDNLLIVDTADALLIAKKGSSQKVKQVVAELKKRTTDIHNTHLTVHRPWGTYTVLEDTPGYKIKRIVVQPGKRLSLQKHLHRSEHWIVVSGTATVTVGKKTLTVRPNESTYIKMGEVHRLANDGTIPVILIEAQVGEYTGEDDIIRIEDAYNRT